MCVCVCVCVCVWCGVVCVCVCVCVCVRWGGGVVFDGSGFVFNFFLVPVFLGYCDMVGAELQKM